MMPLQRMSPEQVQSIDSQLSGVDSEHGSVSATISKIRRDAEKYFSVMQGELGFLSDREVQEQRQYLRTLDPSDKGKIADAWQAYAQESSFVQSSISDNRQIFRDYTERLSEEARKEVISEESKEEWLRWLRDRSRDSKEKKSSLASALPEYLAERRPVAELRQELLKDPALRKAERDGNADIKAKIAFLKSSRDFFGSMEIDQRADLVNSLKRDLEHFEEDQKLYDTMMKSLKEAESQGLITGRVTEYFKSIFYNSAYSHDDRALFVTKTLPNFKKSWAKVHKEAQQVQADAVKQGVDINGVPEIALLATTAFIGKHFEHKEADVARARTALNHTVALRAELQKQADGHLGRAQKAQAITSSKVKEWRSSLFENKRSMPNLQQAVSTLGRYADGWIHEREKFDRLQSEVFDNGVPDGATVLSATEFMNLGYPEKQAYNRKLQSLSLQSIREKNGVTEDDMAAKEAASDQTVEQSNQTTKADVEKEIDEALSTSHPILAKLTRDFLYKENYDTLQALRGAMYNFIWCRNHHYLNKDTRHILQEAAKPETHDIEQNGHSKRMENVDLDYSVSSSNVMRDHRDGTHAPTYIHVSQNKHDAFRNECRENAHNEQWKYWVIADFTDVPYGDIVQFCTSTTYSLKSLKKKWDSAPAAKTISTSGTSKKSSESSLATAA